MFLLINKPPNITSHDVINKLRKICNEKKIGHAGTLDPFAVGLLITAIGRQSTKQLNQLLKLDKTYKAVLQLGATSDTYDLTGKISLKHKNTRLPSPDGEANGGQVKTLKHDDIKNILQKFTGEQKQLPPQYSAKKINGQKAYQLARKGKTANLKPQKITIYDITLKKFDPLVHCPVKVSRKRTPTEREYTLTKHKKLEIEVHCSSGAYIRTLAHDIGQTLGCGAYLTQLKRTTIGPFKLKNAVNLNQLTQANWQKFALPILPDLPNKKTVIAFGTFDLAHKGHINFLQQAKKLGDELYIVIARDKNVKKIKNKLPQDNENKRLKNIKNLNLTDNVMLGQKNLDYCYRILNKIKPDIIALGYDQQINITELKSKLKKYGINPKIIRLKPYCPEKYKTSIDWSA
ncbi:MAG: tRNA pseudouridine(55) synthase TruB [Candidatus Kuenenbacteria bacterium]